MFDTDPDYVDAMRASTRQVDIFLAVGTNVDQTAADDLESVTVSNSLPMSNDTQTTDAIYVIQPGLATFERYGIKAASSANMLAPPIRSEAYPPEVGIWSYDISDSNGDIEWQMTVKLSKAHTSAFSVYTRDVNIIYATIEFFKDGVSVASGPMEASRGRVQYSDAVTYDTVVVSVHGVDVPYSHIRIAEIEFGASRTLSKETLTGKVSIIQETDLTQQSIPLHELDFVILNVLGDWDPDNPVGQFNQIPAGYPIEVGFTCTDERGTKWTVPIGRFILSDKSGSDTELKVTCYDARKYLQDTAMAWGVSTGEDIGTTITNLLTDIRIPHLVDADVFSIIPTESVDFDPEKTLLDDFLFIEQRYGVWLNPGRDGYIHVQTHAPEGSYGVMSKDMMYSHPLPYGFTSFNYLQVSYPVGDMVEYVDLDLRSSSTEIKSQLNIDNPLIRTREQAQALASRLAASRYNAMVETDWRTDLLPDVGDTIDEYGRWQDVTPSSYRVVYQEITYDGGLSATTRVMQ